MNETHNIVCYLLDISIPKTYKHAFIHYNNTWIVNRRIAVMKTFTEPELTAFYSQIVKKTRTISTNITLYHYTLSVMIAINDIICSIRYANILSCWKLRRLRWLRRSATPSLRRYVSLSIATRFATFRITFAIFPSFSPSVATFDSLK